MTKRSDETLFNWCRACRHTMAAIIGNLFVDVFGSSTSCQCCEGTSAAYTHTDTANISFQRAPGTKADRDQRIHNPTDVQRDLEVEL